MEGLQFLFFGRQLVTQNYQRFLGHMECTTTFEDRRDTICVWPPNPDPFLKWQ